MTVGQQLVRAWRESMIGMQQPASTGASNRLISKLSCWRELSILASSNQQANCVLSHQCALANALSSKNTKSVH